MKKLMLLVAMLAMTACATAKGPKLLDLGDSRCNDLGEQDPNMAGVQACVQIVVPKAGCDLAIVQPATKDGKDVVVMGFICAPIVPEDASVAK